MLRDNQPPTPHTPQHHTTNDSTPNPRTPTPRAQTQLLTHTRLFRRPPHYLPPGVRGGETSGWGGVAGALGVWVGVVLCGAGSVV